jgi:hypothetical protein
VTVRKSNIRGARAFCSLPSACCRRFDVQLAASAFESLGSVVQRCSTKLSCDMSDIADIMPALPDPSVWNS